ncbi:MAG: dockerin type I domain-containing protein, partial [Planctomycetota bacterium]
IDYIVTIDGSQINLKGGNATWYVADEMTVLTVLNDDEQDLSSLHVSDDTVSFFDFEGQFSIDGLRAGTFPYPYSEDGPFTSGDFIPDLIRGGDGSSFDVTDGLPVFVDQFDINDTSAFLGAVEKVAGQAYEFTTNSGSTGASLEFTVDSEDRWLPQGIEFFTNSASDLAWELYWDLDGFGLPIFASTDTHAQIEDHSALAPGWNRHRSRVGGLEASREFALPVGNDNRVQFCHPGGPITFRLVATDASSLVVDNLALLGSESLDCWNSADQIAEIIEFIDQQDHRLPGPLSVTGMGIPSVWIEPTPAGKGPDPDPVFHVEIGGTSPSSTTVFLGPATQSSASELMAVQLTTDAGVRNLHLGATESFRGEVLINGNVTDAILLDALTAGSRIVVNNNATDEVALFAEGDWDSGVEILANGRFREFQLSGTWDGGLLSAASVAGAAVTGDFGADVDLDFGYSAFQVGGALRSPLFRTGLEPGVGNGSSGLLRAGNGMSGTYQIDGDVDTISVFDAGATADVIVFGDLSSFVSSGQSGSGGNIGGTIEAQSFGSVESFGGSITATLISIDESATATKIAAFPLNGRGGVIDSPNSFHFAGGIDSIVANQINLRVESGGRIGEIIAVDDGPERPASLGGRFTAHTFGRLRVDENGTADFQLTATAEAWELAGSLAFDEIRVPEGSESWLPDQISLNPSVQPGTIIYGDLAADSDGDGVPNHVEDAAPNSGDGDGDGIPDRNQPNVASIQTSVGSYATLRMEPGNQFRNVQVVNPANLPTGLPPNVRFDSGLLSFEIDTETTGGIAIVDWLMHDDDDSTAAYHLQEAPDGTSAFSSFRNDPQSGLGILALEPRRVSVAYRSGASVDRDPNSETIEVLGGIGLADGIPAINPVNRYDVNNDGSVSPLDALRVINELGRIQAGSSVGAGSSALYDVTDDGLISPLDALVVINHLARQQNNGEGESLERSNEVDNFMASYARHSSSIFDDEEALFPFTDELLF